MDNVFSLPKFLSEHPDDPAVKVMYPVTSWCCIYSDAATHQPDFILCLRNHLLSRLLGLDFDGNERTFTPEQHNEMHLVNPDAVIESKILCVNYTTYDVRRDHDMIHTSHSDFMMTYSMDNEHPFWYAQVLRAFHIKVQFCPEGVSQSRQNMEVLWVRWLGIDQDHKWGFKEARLPKIGYVPDRPGHLPFGFFDPSLVIHGCHLIPAFAEGRTDELLQSGTTLARPPGEMNDWAAFYVNMYAY